MRGASLHAYISKFPHNSRPGFLSCYVTPVHRALGEEDILLGLYEKHLSGQKMTKQALEAELQGDYIKALNIYEEATQHAVEDKDWTESGGSPSEQEMDLWENGRLECLAKLTKWDDLAANTLEEVEHDTTK